tara:strand:- start:114 stop:290 length:177 start_codon:yes stop_codon:yes gene_type:complete
MKVGDLVQWTHKSGPDNGIVTSIDHGAGGALIMWANENAIAFHPLTEKHIKVVNEKEA